MAEAIETAQVESAELDEAGSIETTPSAQPTEVSSDELAKNPEIQAAFARVFGGKGEIDAEDEGEGDEPTPEGEVAEAEGDDEPQEPAAPIKQTAKKTATAPARPAVEEAPAATLAPALQQAAKRAGWTDEDIAEFHQANPDLAEKTFQNLRNSSNELSRRFAQLGQMRMQNPAQPQQQPKPAAPASQQQMSAVEAAYQNLPEFAKNNGEEMAKVVKDLYEGVVAPFKQMQAAYEAQSRQAMAHQVSQQFDTFGKDFSDLYGAAGKLTPEQHQSRFAVAQLADQIRAGANLQGIDMPVHEALEAAHNLFTADRVKEQARKQVQSQVVNRSKRLSARPTQRRTPQTGEGVVRSDATAARAVANWWAERGVDVG